MATELRKTGINVVGDIPWGAHFCHFYESKEELLDILIPYFKTGLENNEFCMWVVADRLGEEEAMEALRRAMPEADQYLEAGHIEIVPDTFFLQPSRQETSPSGQIEIVPHTNWYLKGGAFNPQQVTRGWSEKLAGALAKGYAGMRANGNEAWLSKRHWSDFSQYEKKINETLANQAMIVLCSYPLADLRAAEIFDVVDNHQFAIVRRHTKWEIVESPEVREGKAKIERLNDELEQRVIERTNELRVANEELKKDISERKHAEEKLKATGEQLRALSARLHSAREEEAVRIARAVHDELGAALSSLRWDLEDVDETISKSADRSQFQELRTRIETMMRLTDTTINTVRRIASELRPIALDTLGLSEAIEWQALQFQERTGIVVQCDCALENVDLSREQSTATFRIFQEALTNALRHAQATRVDVTMAEEAGAFVLKIRDNGRGITEDEKVGQNTLGLLGMQERANLIGGELDITGVEGEGTTVTIRLPLFTLGPRTIQKNN